MRAIRVHETGGPEVLAVEEIDAPVPGPGEAVVDVAAAGLNFIEVYQRTGAYPLPTPFTPGMEGAGTVRAVGPEVAAVAEGDRVAWAMVPGAYAEQAVVPADRLVGVPDGVDLRSAAAVMLQGMTAHYLARSTFPLEPGHVVLVHAAAGGVGLLLTQVAARAGAKVLGTVSSDEKARLATEAGAAATIRYDREDVVEAVRHHAPDGVDVVYDGVGQATFEASLEALRTRGTLVLFGQSSGAVPPVDPQRLNQGGSLYLTRPSLAHYASDADERAWRAGEVLGWVRDGELDVRVSETHPLDDAGRAHARLEGRQTTGKVLLLP